MAVHVAIVDGRYVQPILQGRKTVECRLTRTARAPFGCVTPGETIYLKRSGGPVFATARVSAVYLAADLDASAVDRLREEHDHAILGDAAFWRERRKWARYATLVWLRDVQATEHGPAYRRRHMVAWYVLEDEAAPAAATPTERPSGETFEIVLTAGAVRNGYVSLAVGEARIDRACLGGRSREAAGEPLRLDLADGPTVRTDIIATRRGSANGKAASTREARESGGRGRFRWRGWALWFRGCGINPGDRLRFVPRGPRHFRVEPIRRR